LADWVEEAKNFAKQMSENGLVGHVEAMHLVLEADSLVVFSMFGTLLIARLEC